MRHETLLAKNPRMALQVKNVARMTDNQKQAVTLRADALEYSARAAFVDSPCL